MTDTTTKPKRLDAADVRACIKEHFGTNGEQYSVLFEVRNGTAWRANRSVDAVVMGLWPSLGMELWGMEIKVARGDWLHEAKTPGKASEVFDYFDRWFLVAPNDVAKMEELPQPWGWLVPENGRLIKAREAAKNPNVKAVDRHFLGALLRNRARVDEAQIAPAIDAALKRQQETHERDLEKRLLQRIGDFRADAESWSKVRALLKGESDDFIYQPDVIDALRLLLRCGVAKSYSGLRDLINTVDRMRTDLAKIEADLPVPAPEKLAGRRR